MKLLVPIALTLVGLGAGVGAGFALRPAPPPEEEHAAAEAAACPENSETPCDPAKVDPFKPVPKEAKKPEEEQVYVPFEKPFVIPIFRKDKVAAMVVVSLSTQVGVKEEPAVKAAEPLLRDAFLKVMFRHANSGGFDGSFTSGQKIEDLKSGLLTSAQEILPDIPVGEVLITDIARQDV